MRRVELVKAISEKSRSRPIETERNLHLLFALIIAHTGKGDEVIIHGFGTFRFVEVKEKRVVTNGVTRVVPARKVLKFTAARSLRGLGREGGGK